MEIFIHIYLIIMIISHTSAGICIETETWNFDGIRIIPNEILVQWCIIHNGRHFGFKLSVKDVIIQHDRT